MGFLNLTTDTWLDLSVNLIPLGILLVLDLLFWVVNPWGWDPFYVLVAHFLTLFPLAVLAVVTYVAGPSSSATKRGGNWRPRATTAAPSESPRPLPPGHTDGRQSSKIFAGTAPAKFLNRYVRQYQSSFPSPSPASGGGVAQSTSR